ncbi:MAG: peptidase M14 [Candidatus Dadabacteria bacterium]|nr:MAG: peptidase M14 [Candidatus Dadabacteria bacterium]
MSNRPIKKQKTVKPIDINEYPVASRSDVYVTLFQSATGAPLNIPFIICRGSRPGPVLGLTAAVHGDELNGIKIIHNLAGKLDLEKLCGTLLCAPVVNVPAFRAGQRKFIDQVDLNTVFPGKPAGVPAEQYAYAFSKTFLPVCDYLIDLHTASQGRLNCLYVRADLKNAAVRDMALRINPEIILHVPGKDGTLRYAARQRKIPAITVEAGDPSVIQGEMVFEGEVGVRNVMELLGMMPCDVCLTRTPVICKSSKWLRTKSGGLVHTYFGLAERIKKKQLIAETINVFGYSGDKYYAPYDGIVIGRAANPVAIPGMRYCHLGVEGQP